MMLQKNDNEQQFVLVLKQVLFCNYNRCSFFKISAASDTSVMAYSNQPLTPTNVSLTSFLSPKNDVLGNSTDEKFAKQLSCR